MLLCIVKDALRVHTCNLCINYLVLHCSPEHEVVSERLAELACIHVCDVLKQACAWYCALCV